jgi:hypothetical protein
LDKIQQAIAEWEPLLGDSDPGVANEAKAEIARLRAQLPKQGPREPMPGPVGRLEAFGRNAGEGFLPGLHNLMGVGNAIGEYLGGKIDGVPVKKDLDTAFMQEENKPREELVKSREDQPWMSLAGGLTGGAAGLAGQGVLRAGQAISKALPTATGLAQRAENVAATGLGTYAATAPVMSAANELATGDGDMTEVAKAIPRPANDPIGLGLSLVAPAVGAGVSKATRGTSKFIKNYGKARESGVYDRPDMQGLTTDQVGTQTVADRAQQKMFARNADKLNQAGKAQEASVAALEEGNNAYTPSQKAIAALDEISDKNKTIRSNQVRDDAVERAIAEAKILMDIDPATGQSNVRDLLEARRQIAARADHGNPSASREAKAFRKIERAIDDAIPDDVKKGDAVYSNQAAESERFTDILVGDEAPNVSRGVREDGAPDIRAVQERQAARKISRYAEDTIPQASDRRQMDEIRRFDPLYDEQLMLTEAQAAKMATKPGNNKIHESISPQLKSLPGVPWLAQNYRALGGRVIDPLATRLRDSVSPGPLSVPYLRMIEMEADQARDAIKKRKKGR